MKVLNVCIVRQTVSEDYDAENVRVGVGVWTISVRIVILRLTIR